MLKQRIATLLVGGLVLGGGAIALAETDPENPALDSASAQSEPSAEERQARRAQLQECKEARSADPEAEPSEECQALREELGGRRHRHRGPAGAGLLRRGIHGEVIVPQEDGTFDTVVFDKGTVTQAEDGTITLERQDGQSVSVKTDAGTKYRGVDGFDDIEVGQKALVVSKDGTAKVVAQGMKDREGPGGEDVEEPGTPS